MGKTTRTVPEKYPLPTSNTRPEQVATVNRSLCLPHYGTQNIYYVHDCFSLFCLFVCTNKTSAQLRYKLLVAPLSNAVKNMHKKTPNTHMKMNIPKQSQHSLTAVLSLIYMETSFDFLQEQLYCVALNPVVQYIACILTYTSTYKAPAWQQVTNSTNATKWGDTSSFQDMQKHRR